MIKNDCELEQKVKAVGVAIQEIQEYVGHEFRDDAKMKFPTGFIRTATYFKNKLDFIPDPIVKTNLAYAFIQSDVYRWILTRTNLDHVAKSMTIKSCIALLGNICESMARSATSQTPHLGKRHKFCERCSRMQKYGIIHENVKNKLHWLWETRSAIHIDEVPDTEIEKYGDKDYSKAIQATKLLLAALTEWYNSKDDPPITNSQA